jgi:hypothetical protein
MMYAIGSPYGKRLFWLKNKSAYNVVTYKDEQGQIYLVYFDVRRKAWMIRSPWARHCLDWESVSAMQAPERLCYVTRQLDEYLQATYGVNRPRLAVVGA